MGYPDSYQLKACLETLIFHVCNVRDTSIIADSLYDLSRVIYILNIHYFIDGSYRFSKIQICSIRIVIYVKVVIIALHEVTYVTSMSVTHRNIWGEVCNVCIHYTPPSLIPGGATKSTVNYQLIKCSYTNNHKGPLGQMTRPLCVVLVEG